jgi:hypothetical protein
MQTCINIDIDAYADKATASMKIFDSKSNLLHAGTIAKMPLNAYIADRETTSWTVSGLLMIYIVALILAKKYMPVFGIVLFANKNKNITYRDFSHGFTQTANLLAVFSMFTVSIFFYLVELRIGTTHKIPLELFAIIAAGVCFYVFFKLTVIKIIGYVSENSELKSKLFAVEIIILSIYGLFSGFFLTLCFSSPSNSINIWLTVISIIIILLYLFKTAKITMIFIAEKISPFFLILYLCAIEILPAWLIIDFL